VSRLMLENKFWWDGGNTRSLDLYQNIVMSIHSKVLASAYKSVIN
jgi:hypothetical protein